MTIPPREELIHAATERVMEEVRHCEWLAEPITRAVGGLEWSGDVDPLASVHFDDALRGVIRQLVENAYRFPRVGDRVRFMEAAERFPHFIVPAGELGTVTEVTLARKSTALKVGGGQEFVQHLAVRLDGYQPELSEWDNEVHFDECELEEVEQALEVLPAPEYTITPAQSMRLGGLLQGPVDEDPSMVAVGEVRVADPGPGGEDAPNLEVRIGETVHLIAPDGSVDSHDEQAVHRAGK